MLVSLCISLYSPILLCIIHANSAVSDSVVRRLTRLQEKLQSEQKMFAETIMTHENMRQELENMRTTVQQYQAAILSTKREIQALQYEQRHTAIGYHTLQDSYRRHVEAAEQTKHSFERSIMSWQTQLSQEQNLSAEAQHKLTDVRQLHHQLRLFEAKANDADSKVTSLQKQIKALEQTLQVLQKDNESTIKAAAAEAKMLSTKAASVSKNQNGMIVERDNESSTVAAAASTAAASPPAAVPTATPTATPTAVPTAVPTAAPVADSSESQTESTMQPESIVDTTIPTPVETQAAASDKTFSIILPGLSTLKAKIEHDTAMENSNASTNGTNGDTVPEANSAAMSLTDQVAVPPVKLDIAKSATTTDTPAPSSVAADTEMIPVEENKEPTQAPDSSGLPEIQASIVATEAPNASESTVSTVDTTVVSTDTKKEASDASTSPSTVSSDEPVDLVQLISTFYGAIEQAEVRVRAAENAAKDSDNAFALARQELEKLQERMDIETGKVDELKVQLKTKEAEIAHRAAEYEALEQQKKRIELSISDLEAEITHQKQLCEAKDELVQSVEVRAAAADESFQDTAEQYAMMLKGNKLLQSTCNRIRESLRETDEEHDGLMQRVVEAEQTATESELTAQHCRQQVVALRANNLQLMTDRSRLYHIVVAERKRRRELRAKNKKLRTKFRQVLAVVKDGQVDAAVKLLAAVHESDLFGDDSMKDAAADGSGSATATTSTAGAESDSATVDASMQIHEEAA
jgi:chromosome segregation ATPase